MRFLIILISAFILGCTVNLNLDHEYAVNSGDGSLSESQTVEETAETKADVSATVDESL